MINNQLLSPSKLFSDAWAEYKQKAKKLAIIMVAFYVAMGIIGLIFGGSAFFYSSGESISQGSIVLFVVGGILLLVAGLLTEIVLIRVAAGRESELKHAYKNALHKIVPFLGLAILVGLTILVGFVVLIIPGIIFIVWYCFSYPVFLLEDTGVVESMRRSKSYVKGRFWAVLGRVVVLFIILLPFMVLSSIADATHVDALGFIVDIATGLFAAPLSVVYMLHVYRNAKETAAEKLA